MLIVFGGLPGTGKTTLARAGNAGADVPLSRSVDISLTILGVASRAQKTETPPEEPALWSSAALIVFDSTTS